ncbi:hypothetical protein R1flu_028276 [Riccia fluitans]|uniref:Uncharacterized protein n=1 Tax=Riccia fluitans TaxID=41844 RepID=A0ABD1XQ85_9MARC
MIKGGSSLDRLQHLHDDDFHVALLHLAIKEDDILAIKDLIRVPNWIHAADRSGRNALHWAVAFGTKEACELLFSHTGEDGIHHHDKIGRTPLHFAAIWGRSDVAKLILARGAEANITDRKSMTPLHYAAQNSNPFLIRSIIKRGADKQARDSRRRTPYHIALQWGSPVEILDLLDPEFNRNKGHRLHNMPQARRFAASLYPGGHHSIPRLGSNARKDFHAELLKYEMQKQADKIRRRLSKILSKRMKKRDPSGAHFKAFALKALAARRKKRETEYHMKKSHEKKRLLQIKNERREASGRSSPSLPISPRNRNPRSGASSGRSTPSSKDVSSRDDESSHTWSKTLTETKSSLSSSPRVHRVAEVKSSQTRLLKNYKATEIKSSPSSSRVLYNAAAIMARVLTPPTFFRPNTPNSSKPPSSPKPLRPNPGARFGWPSPPGSIRAYGGKTKTLSYPSKARNDMNPPSSKLLKRAPSPERRALSEFVGTSARHNALGKYPTPPVHRCIDILKLQKQWL